jgi:hypothetical protein
MASQTVGRNSVAEVAEYSSIILNTASSIHCIHTHTRDAVYVQPANIVTK